MSIISDTISNLNKVKPNEVLGFKPDFPYDRIGTTKTLGCIWVRQNSLMSYSIHNVAQILKGNKPIS